jgi:CarboxypepD_reg-like domain
MNENKNSNQFSAEDIQRYLKGQMSAQEMHAIETAALDDPFLADAIEGFETAMAAGKEESIQKGLMELEERFDKRVKPTRELVPLIQSKWWKIAAAALIVIITGVAFYNNWIKPEATKDALAVHKAQLKDSSAVQQSKQKGPATSANSLIQQNGVDTPSSTEISQSAEIKSSPPLEINKSKPGKELSKERNTAIPKAEEDGKDDFAGRIAIADSTREEVTSKPLTSDKDSRNAEKALESKVSGLYTRDQVSRQLNSFSGRVVDPENKPLPNASLQVMSNNTRLVTDQAGNFNFTDKDSVVTVKVDMVGFEHGNFRLQNSVASNKLVLEPIKESLDEVVIVGYGNQRKKDITKATVKVQDAVPQIGWIEYEKYLEKNKKPPVNNPLMTGEVVVSFVVKRWGSLSDFKIEKSMSKDYDAEAIRLIREGPAWKLLRGYKSRITVIVNF